MTRKSTPQVRAAKAGVAGLVATATNMGVQVLTVPIVLTYWGAERYGIWLAILATFMLTRVFDTGYVTFVGNQLNVLFHQDEQKLRGTLASSFLICSLLGLLQLCLCLLLLSSGLASRLLGFPQSTGGDHDYLALAVLVIGWMVGGSFPSVVHRLLVPAGMYVKSIWWGLGYQVAQTGALIAAAIFDASLLQAATIYVAVQATVYLASAAYVATKLPELFPWWRGGCARTGFKDLASSALVTLSAAAQQAGLNGTVLLVSTYLTAVAVPAFTTVRTFANLGTMLSGVVVNAVSPEVVRYYATRQRDKLRVALRLSALGSTLSVNVVLLALLPFAEGIYRAWTKDRVVFDRQLFLLFVAAVSVASSALPYSNFIATINDLRAQISVSLLRSLTAIGIGLALVLHLGLPGVGVGILSGEVFSGIAAMFVFAPKAIEPTRTASFVKEQLKDVMPSLPVLVVCIYGTVFDLIPLWLIGLAALGVAGLTSRAWYCLPDEVKVRASDAFRRVSARA